MQTKSRRISDVDTTWKQKRQCTYKFKIEAHSSRHFFAKQKHSRIYPKCKAHVQCYIVICGLSGCTIFFSHGLINGTIFEEKSYWT